MQFRKLSTTALNLKQECKIIKYSHDLSNAASFKVYVSYSYWKHLFTQIQCLVTLAIVYLFIYLFNAPQVNPSSLSNCWQFLKQ